MCIVCTQGESFQTVNLDPNPNVTLTNGSCGNDGSDSALMLISEKMTVQFIFTNVSIFNSLDQLKFYTISQVFLSSTSDKDIGIPLVHPNLGPLL